MANIIAVVWDCDKTLIDGYMQDPIFEEYKVDPKAFWEEVNDAPAMYARQGVKVNPETIYLNYFIRKTKDGTFAGLNNARLREFGRKQKFYPGILDFFRTSRDLFNGDPRYQEYNIKVEHYIVSTGFAEVVRGTELSNYVENIWGCELIEEENAAGERIISEIGYTIDNTTKTRALFEINKGIPKLEKIDVNTKIAKEKRRVQFENMIYIADGPSDIPAFSVVHQNKGHTFAIYPAGDVAAMRQVEGMCQDGRVDMYAEADYREGTTAYLWITEKIRQIAERIRKEEQDKILGSLSEVPRHLSS